MLLSQIDKIFPTKSVKINENDQPWADYKLISLDRRRKREYSRNKKSQKWMNLNNLFNERAAQLKKSYYQNVVEDLKESNISQWYSKIKHMSSIDPTHEEYPQVTELVDLPSSDQAECIADKFAEISQMYEPLKAEDIKIPDSSHSKPPPLFEAYQIHEQISKMKRKSSTIEGDIPWTIIREFSVELAAPICNIFNSCTLLGIWPEAWKHEHVTPVPKVYPPKTTDDLRKIALTKNLSKLYEALLSKHIISDLSPNIDRAQYGNEKGLSITHYLINMINKILTSVDVNNSKEKYAIVAQLIDWSKAFDRQDAKLGINAFIRNGVRATLIPLLISFFQNRRMTVKWHGQKSTSRQLPGGGPQGSTFGNLQFKVSSNENADHVPQDMRYKFVDDLSILELINLILVGLSSYNFRKHVASDIGIDQNYLPAENFYSQQSLNEIENWTEKNLSKLNTSKSKIMVFNFTEEKFATRLLLENVILETVHETKLLGTIITSDLKWHSNTDMLCKKAYKRMIILQKLNKFGVNIEDMLIIYKLYVRSIVEQNCPVWHHSLSEEDQYDLERTQKVASKIILQQNYIDYKQALKVLNLETLFDRREKLSLKFAKKCTSHPKASMMFPLNQESSYSTRYHEKYKVQSSRTSRLQFSAIPQLQRALNADYLEKVNK